MYKLILFLLVTFAAWGQYPEASGIGGGGSGSLGSLTGVIKAVTGTPSVVTGTATYCVLVDGTSAPCFNPGDTVDLSATNNIYNLGTLGKLVIEYPNAAVTGTTAGKLAIIDSSGNAVIAGTSNTTNIAGVVVDGAGTTGTSRILRIGTMYMEMDGATTLNNWAIASVSAGGKARDSGSATYPTGVDVVGRIKETIGSAGPALVLVDVQPAQVVRSLISTTGAVTDPGGAAAVQFNNAAGALTFNAPAGVAGVQRCYRNAATRTGVITIQMATSNTVDVDGANGTSAGTLVSGGALGDAVCIVSDAVNHWYGYVQKGTWTNN